LVIGKGGETIKMLQSKTGAQIQVARDTEADPNGMRPITISGTPMQMEAARREIDQLIAVRFMWQSTCVCACVFVKLLEGCVVSFSARHAPTLYSTASRSTRWNPTGASCTRPSPRACLRLLSIVLLETASRLSVWCGLFIESHHIIAKAMTRLEKFLSASPVCVCVQ
jgi:hypothetical protein